MKIYLFLHKYPLFHWFNALETKKLSLLYRSNAIAYMIERQIMETIRKTKEMALITFDKVEGCCELRLCNITHEIDKRRRE